jgi:4-hydroxybenzoate polyprenyltransferase
MNPAPNSEWISWLDYLFVLRPMLFYPGWSTLLAGFFIAGSADQSVVNWPLSNIDQRTIFTLLLSFAAVMGGSFILNQLEDVESDRQNKKLFIISGGLLKRNYLVVETIILTTLSLCLALTVNFRSTVLIVLFFMVTGILYNFHPLAMKDRPWGSLSANMMMGGLAFTVGWCALRPCSMDIIPDILPYLFFNTALYLFTTLPDIEGDIQANKKTLAVIYGRTGMVRAAFGLYSAGFICALVYTDLLALIFYALSLPFFVNTIFTNRIADTLRATKFGILFFALAICLHWPPYFLLMVTGFYATRFYFRRRFNFNYPNFSGN